MTHAWPALKRTVIAANQWPPEIDSIEGRFVDASNATLLARAVDGTALIYKPEAGQRPLHDFDVATLPRREYLAYRVSESMGIGCVPRTALVDGPAGPGSVQEVIDHETDINGLVDMINQGDSRLLPIAMLDVVINNADRKVGHIFVEEAHLWAIDHGLSFHLDDKLRTVLWSLAGRAVTETLVSSLKRVRTDSALIAEMAELLGEPESRAFCQRVDALLDDPFHPEPPDDRPAMPWPYF